MINEALRNLLISLKDRALELEAEYLQIHTRYDGYPLNLETLHLENAEKLNDIIEQHGWPGRSLVGTEGADAAFTLAQHSISKPELQRQFFQHINEAAKNGEATPCQAACLEDRIRFNEGKPQRYGMFFNWDESGVLIANVENLDLANKLRKEMGLKTVEEAKEIHRKEIEEEGGGRPLDFHEHKRNELAWAKRVGWRE